MKSVVLFSMGILAVAFFTNCGKSTSATVKVGSIPNVSSLKKMARHLMRPASDAVQSTTEFAFAKVDGIKLNLTRLQVMNGNSEKDIISWSPSKEVVIAPGTDNTLQLTETASVPLGNYTGVKVRYDNAFSFFYLGNDGCHRNLSHGRDLRLFSNRS